MQPRQQPPTGEHFIMRVPRGIETHPTRLAYWTALVAAIKQCGGDVKIFPAEGNSLENASMYVRDAALPFYMDDGRLRYIEPQQNGEAHARQNSAIGQYLRDAQYAEFKELMPGRVEGGNVVQDPHRNQVFWLSNNAQFMLGEKLREKRLREGAADNGSTPEQRWYATNYPEMEAMDYAQRWLTGEGTSIAPNKTAPRIIGLFVDDQISDTFYHLDGLLGMLPSGPAVVARHLFPALARQQLDHYIGRENMIQISYEEAEQGATNFITVGKNIITPYASERMKREFKAFGYDVIDPPAMGLPEGAWMFGPMASVRCVTLKVTPDMGFPQHVAARAPVTAK